MDPNASCSGAISKLPTPASSESSKSVFRRSFKCVDVHCNKVFKDKLSYENHRQIRHGGLLKTHHQSVAHVLGFSSNHESSGVGLRSPNDFLVLKGSHDHKDDLIVGQHDLPGDTAPLSTQGVDKFVHCQIPDPQDLICDSLDERSHLSASIASKEHSSKKANSCEYNECRTEVDQETIFHEQIHLDLQHESPEAELGQLEVDHQDLFEVRPQLERQGSVAAETYQFFKRYDDGYEDVFEGLGKLSPPLESLSKSSKALLKFCSKKCMTLGESRDLFGLVTELERLSSLNAADNTPKQPLSSDFKTGEAFSAYLRSARRHSVARENWKTAVIRSRFGSNKTGVFRCVLGVMLEKIKDQGGVKSIIDFQIETKEGDRIYSAPWNSEAMHDYQRNLPRAGKIVLFDVYSDGTCLSNSGTQSANLMRVRFSNIRGITDKWHEVGIVPTVQTNGHSASDSKLRKEKNALWHRFAFVGFEALIRKSRLGVMIEGVEVFPRLGMVVADQVQERPTFGLKGHDSFFDCTHCLMPSKDSSLKQEEVNKKRKRSPSHGDNESMDSGQITSESIDSGQSTSGVQTPGGNSTSRTVVEIDRSTGRVKSIQLGTDSYPRRDVFRTVKKQLKLAKKSSEPIPGVVSEKGKRYGPQRHEIKEAQKYLRAVSAGEFPPAFAAIEGAGSIPYRLYSSIGFDKLHAWEHGVSRMLTDDAFKIFESSPQYNGYSKSRVVNIANQRIADLPRSAQLKRFPAYRKNSHESHAGVTGNMRRDLLCFLWVSVMGIPQSVPPGDVEFLQLLLTADLFQRKLMGINTTSSAAKRTFSEIQEVAKLGFEVGNRVASLFDCAVNTKIHRVMRHILDHFVDFGCIRKGSTDDNETQHKVTKKGYKSTNKHASKIAPQLLAARASVSATDVDESAQHNGSINVSKSTGVAQLLLTRDLSTTVARMVVTENDYEGDITIIPENEIELVKEMNSAIENTSCIEEAEKAVRSRTHITSNENVWNSVKSARFVATLPWSRETKVHQTVYAGEDIFRYRRRDAVSYSIGGTIYTGILQAIFSYHRNSCHRVALVRRLKRIPAEPKNCSVVEKYGNVRFGYEMDGSDVKKDCVSITKFIRKVMLIPDPWLASRLYGPDMRFSTLPDDKHSRRVEAFFEVAGYQFSSHNEQLLDTQK